MRITILPFFAKATWHCANGHETYQLGRYVPECCATAGCTAEIESKNPGAGVPVEEG